MTIKRRLSLGFATILALFAVNVAVQSWGTSRRGGTIDALRKAIERQALIAKISQDVKDLQKQIALLSQDNNDSALTELDPDEKLRFSASVEKASKEIDRLVTLSSGASRTHAEAAAKTFSDLRHSWQVFTEKLGVKQAEAIMELAVNSEPLSQQFIQQMLPELQKEVDAGVDEASSNYDAVASITQRFGAGVFGLSGLIGIWVAILVSRHIGSGLRKVQAGAERIGAGDLEYRIHITAKNELGELASSYNSMAAKLQTARGQLTEANQELAVKHDQVVEQQKISEGLLLNILPAQVAEELRAYKNVRPRYYEDVTILFTDFVGFGRSTEHLAADDVVEALNGYFTDFDEIVQRYGIEKIKTIGDSYMCVAGLPVRSPSHPVDMVLAAAEMVRAVERRSNASAFVKWKIRVGINTGPVIAGVVGIRKFAYDIWGDSVNFASRMESSGAPNLINISERTYLRVKDFFECEPRGQVLTKDKQEVNMYFVKGIQPALLKGGLVLPPPAFAYRYHGYFQKEPTAFPDFMVPQLGQETLQ